MSIITEALKKVQTGRYDQFAIEKREGENRVSAVSRAGQMTPSKSTLFFNALLAAAVAGMISAGMFFLWRSRQSVMEMPLFGKGTMASPGLKDESAVEEPAPEILVTDTGCQEGGDIEYTAALYSGRRRRDDASATHPMGQRHFIVSGIMSSPSHPQAIINGRIIGEGETVDGFTVNHIGPGTVRGILDGRDFELKLE